MNALEQTEKLLATMTRAERRKYCNGSLATWVMPFPESKVPPVFVAESHVLSGGPE